MSKESKAQKQPQVKRKRNRVAHTVEDGFIITIRELTRGMAPDCVGKTRRGRVNNSAYHIKKAILAWADGFPKKINGVPTGFTPAFRDVFKVLAWALFMDRGYAVFRYEDLADAAGCHRDTAKDAVHYFCARGLLQWKTGKGWEQKDRRNLANQYTVNLWAFINPETGEIIAPSYHTGTYEWKTTAAVFRCRLENTHMVVKQDAGSSGVREKADHRGKIPIRSDQENGVTEPKRMGKIPMYKSNGKGGASLPAPADAGASAPLNIESGVGVPMPYEPEYGPLRVRYAKVKTLVTKLKFTIMEIIEGKGKQAFLQICTSEIYPSEIRGDRIFDEQRPEAFRPYGHIIVNDESEKVSYVEGGNFRIDLDDLNDGDVLVIEYHPSRKRIEATAKRFKEMRTGYG